MSGSRCDACGCVFGGVTAFDLHRTGHFEKGHIGGRKKRYIVDQPCTRRCLSAKEMEAKGLVFENGKWSVPFNQKRAS